MPAGAFAHRVCMIWAIIALGRGRAAKRRPAAAIFQESVMERRVTSKLVIFRKPFWLSGLDGEQLPGTYTVQIEEEVLDGVSLIGWRQTHAALVLSRDGGTEYVAIDPQELREALVKDGDQGTDPPAAPSQASSTPPRHQMRRKSRQ